MKFALPKIYPITDARLAGISHAEQVQKLIKGGAEIIQLREKYAAPKDFYESAAEALKIARKYNVKIVINDRADIALALRADGVHLGQDDLPPERAREILGEKAIIGFSTHNLEQAAHAAKLPVSYIAFGPVFPTRTKENPDPTVGIEQLQQIRATIGDIPMVAIGGINSKNFQEILESGADSIAIISDLISDANSIENKMKMFLEKSKS